MLASSNGSPSNAATSSSPRLEGSIKGLLQEGVIATCSEKIVDFHISRNGFALSDQYASFSAAVPEFENFLDNDDTGRWNRWQYMKAADSSVQLSSPADSSLFPNISQTAAQTNIARTDTVAYEGYSMGVMRIDGVRKLLLGNSLINVDFANSEFDLLIVLFELNRDQLLNPDHFALHIQLFQSAFSNRCIPQRLLYDDMDWVRRVLTVESIKATGPVTAITARNIKFKTNGQLVGNPEARINPSIYAGSGRAQELAELTVALRGGFRGPDGETLILNGGGISGNDTIIWGMIGGSSDVPIFPSITGFPRKLILPVN